MKALSLWQPWASLIALGLKQYETRSWSTPYRGLIAIHAAKRWTRDEAYALDDLATRFDQIWRAISYPLPLGAVLCVCNLTACLPTHNLAMSTLERAVGNYAPGRFAWKLEIVEVFEQPIPAKGAQGLWNWERPAA